MMLRSLVEKTLQYVDDTKLPKLAKAEIKKDYTGLPEFDLGNDKVIDECIAWLGRAQDFSASADGGVAREYNLVSGWATSYPETTGYIVPTLIEYAKLHNNDEVLERARRMLDWLVSIQLQDGGFQGGLIDATPVVSVTFNTGQILLGLASGVSAFGESYRESMRAAADFLLNSQDEDGCWRSHPTPFAAPGEKVYETHVSWGLFEAERVDPNRGYGECGLRNARWALSFQRDNGWFDCCCLDFPEQPLAHTIGYNLRGLVEAYRLSSDSSILDACKLNANGILTAIKQDGFLSGRLDSNWKPKAKWACLTGSAQIAHSMLFLYQFTGDEKYRNAGFVLNSFVRRTVSLDGPPETRGGVKGAFPVDGDYGRLQYLNWAPKFLIDSLLLELEIRSANS